jgi:hypothetical protein
VSGRVIPFRRPGASSADHGEFEEIRCARDHGEALVIRGLLEAHGIFTLLKTRVAQSVHPFTVGEQGEVRILVLRGAVAEARRLLDHVEPAPS